MQRLEQNIAEVREQLRSEITRVVGTHRRGLPGGPAQRAGARRRRWTEQRGLARQLGDQMVQYSLLRRDVDTSRELYTALLTRLKETQISSALLTSNIAIVDRAEVPLVAVEAPPGPEPPASPCVIGLFGGVGLAFFFEYLDTNIKDAREVETILGVPTIGLVPSQGSIGGRRTRAPPPAGRGERGRRYAPFALVAHTETESVLSEVFRNLRTSLLYSSPDHPPKTFMITSLQPEDGKTSMATNLAIALGQLGAGEVLLIDGDMRRPNLHELLRGAAGAGALDLPHGPGRAARRPQAHEDPEPLRDPGGPHPAQPGRADGLGAARPGARAPRRAIRPHRLRRSAADRRQRRDDPGAPARGRDPRATPRAREPRRGPAGAPAPRLGPRAGPRRRAERRRREPRRLRLLRLLRYYGYGNGDRGAAAEPRPGPGPRVPGLAGSAPRSASRTARCWSASSPGWRRLLVLRCTLVGRRVAREGDRGARRSPITSPARPPASPSSSARSRWDPATRTSTVRLARAELGAFGGRSRRGPPPRSRPRSAAGPTHAGTWLQLALLADRRGRRRRPRKPSTPRSGSTATTSALAGRRRSSCSAGASRTRASSTSGTSSPSTPRRRDAAFQLAPRARSRPATSRDRA